MANATLAMAALFSQGQPGGFGVFVPAGDGPMPSYFSGTNCRASGNAQIGEPIIAAVLTLNGEIVAEYAHSGSPEEPLPMSMGLAVMFDSSHFPSGSVVEVKFWVYGLFTQQWYSASRSRATWNWAMMYEHPDPGISPDAVSVVFNEMSGQNYWLILHNGGQWTPAQYFSSMEGANVVFCATHGAPSVHEAGNTDGISDTDYLFARENHVGQGLPPFNSGAPIINFFHLLACNCGIGIEATFKKCLYPYYMGWGGPELENQAVFAYSVYVYLDEYYRLAEAIWPRMVYGWTAGMTKEWFDEMLLLGHLKFDAKDFGGHAIRPMAPGDLVLLHGQDLGACRIKTVYTGTNTPPIGWYRQMS